MRCDGSAVDVGAERLGQRDPLDQPVRTRLDGVGPEVPRREVDRVLPDGLLGRIVDEHRGDRVEPDASPVVVAEHRGTIGRAVLVVDQDHRPADPVQLGLPARERCA